MNTSSKELRRLNYLFSETNALYHEAAQKLGLSFSEMAVLYTLCSEGKCGISDVCRLMGVQKQTVNSALRKLERDDIVRLEALDGKQKLIDLTPKGNRFVKKTIAKLIEAENRVLGGWSEAERREYLRLTEKYLCDFKKEVNTACI